MNGNKKFLIFLEYGLVSLSALLIDLLTFKYLSIQRCFETPTNAALSYCAGLFWAYGLFIRRVFKNGRLKKNRALEFAMFGLSGILGSSISFFTSWIMTDLMQSTPWEAKFVAVAISFVSVYLFRIKFVF
jgi:putative flippase GtrA